MSVWPHVCRTAVVIAYQNKALVYGILFEAAVETLKIAGDPEHLGAEIGFSDLLRQREDHMEILDRQQVGLARFKPMPIPAARVGNLLLPTCTALPKMSS